MIKIFLTTLLIIVFKCAINGQCTWTPVGISTGFSGGQANFTAIALDTSTGIPYVIYRDDVNGSKATVQKFNGTAWQVVGIAGFSVGQVGYCDIAIDPTGTPYVIYSNGGITVQKFNGTSWQVVGTTGFGTNSSYTSIAIDQSGIVYVAYRDYVGGVYFPVVLKFDGTSWQDISGLYLSQDDPAYISIAVDYNGIPYIAYRDAGVGPGVAFVKKYNGTIWQVVGGVYVSSGAADYVSIAIDQSNTPYVLYMDGSNASKATCKKFNGTSWQTVGLAGFSSGQAAFTSIAINPSGIPYVVYRNSTNNATVQLFNGTNWQTVGILGFPAVYADFTNLVIDATGTPYVVYRGSGYKANVMKYACGTATGINETNNAVDVFKLYPNPNVGVFKIELDVFKNYQIIVSNTLGKSVYKTALNQNTTTIDINKFGTGIYFVKIIDESNSVIGVKKVIVE